MKEYDVIWHHIGDRAYNRGDVRKANPQAVRELVRRGILKEREPDKAKPKKKKTAPKNKAQATAPMNKAEGGAPQNKTKAPVKPITSASVTDKRQPKKRGLFGRNKGKA